MRGWMRFILTPISALLAGKCWWWWVFGVGRCVAIPPPFSGNYFPVLTNAANYGMMVSGGKETQTISNRPQNSERKSENDHQPLHAQVGRH